MFIFSVDDPFQVIQCLYRLFKPCSLMTILVCMRFWLLNIKTGSMIQLLYKFLLNVIVEFQGRSVLIFKDVEVRNIK